MVGLLAVAILGLPSASAHDGTLIIVVRHAEKADTARDPVLSEAGEARAEVLADVLHNAGLDAVYASQYLRTQLTAGPAARAAGLEVRVEPIEGEVEAWALRFAEVLIERHPGEVVLVVGHSNTVPPLVAALCRCQVETLADSDYDRIFIVGTRDREPGNLIRSRFGASSDDWNAP